MIFRVIVFIVSSVCMVSLDAMRPFAKMASEIPAFKAGLPVNGARLFSSETEKAYQEWCDAFANNIQDEQRQAPFKKASKLRKRCDELKNQYPKDVALYEALFKEVCQKLNLLAQGRRVPCDKSKSYSEFSYKNIKGDISRVTFFYNTSTPRAALYAQELHEYASIERIRKSIYELAQINNAIENQTRLPQNNVYESRIIGKIASTGAGVLATIASLPILSIFAGLPGLFAYESIADKFKGSDLDFVRRQKEERVNAIKAQYKEKNQFNHREVR